MKVEQITAKVESINPLTDSILQLILSPEYYVDYKAGQYLNIILDEQEFSYSIANAPLGSKKYELHIRHSKDNDSNKNILALIKDKGELSIKLPLGECFLNKLEPNKPILFIAGGTGFAPIKAMIEQLLANGDERAFELIWGARAKNDLYMDDKVSLWKAHVSHFNYYSLFEGSKDGLAHIIERHHPNDLKDWQIVINGPFDMVFAIRDFLVNKGLEQKQLYSDAFYFEGKI